MRPFVIVMGGPKIWPRQKREAYTGLWQVLVAGSLRISSQLVSDRADGLDRHPFLSHVYIYQLVLLLGKEKINVMYDLSKICRIHT